MPSTSIKPKSAFKPNKSKASPSTIIQPPPQASHHDDGSDDEEDDEDEDEDDLELDDSEEDEFEEDRQRTGGGVAVWEDDEGEEFDEESSEGEDEDEEEDEAAAQSSRLVKGKGRETELSKLQSGLRDIPLSTLLKVNRSLPKRQRHNDPEPANEDDLSGSEGEGEETEKERQKRERVAEAREKLAQMMAGKKGGASAGGAGEGGGEEERAYRERKALAKRADKHAPQVLSSKKQVSRKRQVIEIEKVERRDPRFSNLSGSLDPYLHSKAYSFLPTMLSTELTDLQASLKVAKKAVLSAPRHERRDKEAEVERIEMELGKVRTRREREARERREREAVGKWKKEERAKRGEGKKEWHLKDADKKRLLAEAKHAALLEQGGQFAVKKSLDKRLKKDAGKEKKARPRGLDGASGADGSRKRVKM